MVEPEYLSRLADLVEAEDIHPREFSDAIVAAYSFDTPIGRVSYADFIEIIAAAAHNTGRIDRLIVEEEIQAFGAYLRAVGRSRSVMKRLAAPDDA